MAISWEEYTPSRLISQQQQPLAAAPPPVVPTPQRFQPIPTATLKGIAEPAPFDTADAILAKLNASVPKLDFSGFDAAEAAPAPTAESGPGVLSDVGNLLKSGYASTAQGINYLGSKVPGINELVDFEGGQQYWADVAQGAHGALSPAQQAAGQKKFINEDLSLGEAWSDPRAYLGPVTESVPGTVIGMGVGAPLALGAKALGAGAGLAGAVGYGVGEGAVAAGSAGAGLRDEILAMPIDTLAKQSPLFKQLIGEGVTPEAARARVADETAAQAALQTGLTTAALGAPTGAMMGKLFHGGGPIAKSMAGTIGVGAAGEAAQEFGQSGAEQLIRNLAVQQNVDPAQSLSQDVLNQAVTGAVAGAVMGGGMGGAGRIAQQADAAKVVNDIATVSSEIQNDIQAPPDEILKQVLARAAEVESAGVASKKTQASIKAAVEPLQQELARREARRAPTPTGEPGQALDADAILAGLQNAPPAMLDSEAERLAALGDEQMREIRGASKRDQEKRQRKSEAERLNAARATGEREASADALLEGLQSAPPATLETGLDSEMPSAPPAPASTADDIVQAQQAEQSARPAPQRPSARPEKPARQGKPTPSAPAPTTAPTEPAPPLENERAMPFEEADLEGLTLSEDVPQFKSGANEKGVVEPLGGKFDRTGAAPIIVWERKDGRREIISGRHRADLARRSGEKTIPAQIMREADGFDAKQAANLDAELNIRDGQGKVSDYVQYFRNKNFSEKEANLRGLVSRRIGKTAYEIATNGDTELVAAHRSGRVSDEAAFAISRAAPKNSRLQAVGLKAIQDGKSAANAANLIEAVKAMGAERGVSADIGDMFGFDDSAMKEAAQMAGIATKRQRQMSERLAAIQGAARRPEVARREGVDVKDVEALNAKIEQIKTERERWDKWSTDPELLGEIRKEMGGKDKPAAPSAPAPAPEAPKREKTASELLDEDMAAGVKPSETATAWNSANPAERAEILKPHVAPGVDPGPMAEQWPTWDDVPPAMKKILRATIAARAASPAAPQPEPPLLSDYTLEEVKKREAERAAAEDARKAAEAAADAKAQTPAPEETQDERNRRIFREEIAKRRQHAASAGQPVEPGGEKGPTGNGMGQGDVPVEREGPGQRTGDTNQPAETGGSERQGGAGVPDNAPAVPGKRGAAKVRGAGRQPGPDGIVSRRKHPGRGGATGGEGVRSEAKGPGQPAGDAGRPVSQPLASAGKELAQGVEKALDGLITLFGAKAKGRLGSGLSFDEDTYRQAVPLFKEALAHFKQAAQDIRAAINAMIDALMAKGADLDTIEAMEPYITRFAGDLENGAVDLEPTPEPEPEPVKPVRGDFAAQREAQRAAESIAVKTGDLENIRATLPYLLPEQQEDVLKAEQRFERHDGILFTNGTGSGKTYTGLGIIKRFVKQGKTNGIIVVPSQAKVSDWIGDGQNLGLDIAALKDIDDGGKGVVITTYANFYENDELSKRTWDFVMYDESHKLASNQAGEATVYQARHEQVTLRPEGLRARAESMLGTADKAALAGLREAQKKADKVPLTPQQRADIGRLDALIADERAKLAQLPKPKVVFLSATPFAYHFNLDYANGFLFDWGTSEARGYNQPNARQAFFIQHFGYRMSYGKLTSPEGGVDVDLMERRFHEWLKATGAVSGRKLEMEQDYSRQFVEIDNAMGKAIDRGIDILSGRDPAGRNGVAQKFPRLYDKLKQNLDFLAKSRLLEGIKAKAAADRAAQHVKMGRKVVVFHDYIEGSPKHPFKFEKKPGASSDPEIAAWNAEVAEFNGSFGDLVDLPLDHLDRVIGTFQAKFGDRLRLFNGRETGKRRAAAIAEFNQDNDDAQVIVVQRDAGKEGISLHDVTGKMPRVLMDLGLPTAPTEAIQTEGRIYRFGQRSNATIEYLKTNTSFEESMFASRVATRARTAENLAMGDASRNLEQAFVRAYIESDADAPHAQQGTGGKEGDARMQRDEPFDVARALYFGQQKKNQRTKAQEGVDYFATPEPVGLKMVEWAALQSGESALEPSAGHGAIARWFPEDASKNTFVEPSPELVARLGLNARGKILDHSFENLHITNKYDAIIMNPPFHKGGSLAIAHLEKAETHLRNGGRIVILLPEGPDADKRFDAFMERNKTLFKVAEFGLPAVTFERAGTNVKTRVLVLEKHLNPAGAPNGKSRIDLDADKIGELFDKIRHLSVPPRSTPIPVEKKAAPAATAAPSNITLNAKNIDQTVAAMRAAMQPEWIDASTDTIKMSEAGIAEIIGRLAPDLAKESEAVRARVASLGIRSAYLAGPVNRLYSLGYAVASPTVKGSVRLSEKGLSLLYEYQSVARSLLADAIESAPPAPPPAAPKPNPIADAMTPKLAIVETVHAKKTQAAGRPVPWFAVTLANKVSNAAYQSLAATAKRHGGYYSSYKSQGAVPGFQFPSRDKAEAFMAEAGGERRSMPATAARPTTAASARAELVEVLGERAVKAMEKAGTLKFADDVHRTGAAGFVDRSGHITLIPENMDQGAIGVALHEGMHLARDSRFFDGDRRAIAVAHAALRLFGLKNFIGNPGYTDLIQQVHRMAAEGDKIAQAALQKARIEKRADPTGVDENEEALAYLAQYADQRPGLVRRIVAAIRAALYRMGVTMKLSPNDVRAIAVSALKARAKAAKQAVATRAAPAYSLADFEPGAADLAEVERQMASVQEVRDAKGKLLAPNGKPSKLTERQWKQVRTENFKAWFGDWENDPENASRVVDANGEPLVVYHGSERAGYHTFQSSHRSKVPGAFFFTDNRRMASTYSGSDKDAEIAEDEDGYIDERSAVYPVFLNLRSGNEIEFGGANWDGRLQEPYYDLMDEDGKIVDTAYSLDEAEEAIEEGRASEYQEVDSLFTTTDSEAIQAMESGQDGVILRDVQDEGAHGYGGEAGDLFIVFDPGQIKSATLNAGTYSRRSDRIDYSQPADAAEDAEQERIWQEFLAVQAQFQAKQSSQSAFQRWFGKGTEGVTARDGKPIILYHGTNNPEFHQWDSTRAGDASGHPTSGLGFFMVADKGSAARYGSRLLELHAKIDKPYYLTNDDLTAIETPRDAARLRGRLQAKGYDGAVVTAPGAAPYVIAFTSQQAKYITNQNPTASEDFRYSRSPRVRRTMAELLDGIDRMQDWHDWYDRNTAIVARLFGEDARLFQDILSATSQASTVKGNVSLALKAYKQLKEGAPFEGYMPAVVQNLTRIRNNETAQGAKIAEYSKASQGEDSAIAVDRHIAMLFFDTIRPSAAQIAAAKTRIRSLAKKTGLTPRQTQAVLWAYNQTIRGVDPSEVQSYDTLLEKRADEIRALRSAFDDAGREGGSLSQRGDAAAGTGEGQAEETEGLRYSRPGRASMTVEEAKSYGIQVEQNEDGTITLYHGAGKDAAKKIAQQKRFERGTYFSHSEEVTGYGDEPPSYYANVKNKGGTVLSEKVDPDSVEFVSGTGEFFAPDGLAKGKDGVWRSPSSAAESRDRAATQRAPTVQDVYGDQIQVGGQWYHAERIFGKPASSYKIGDAVPELAGSTVRYSRPGLPPVLDHARQALAERGESALSGTKTFLKRLQNPLHGIPDLKDYMLERYLAQGRIAESRDETRALYDLFSTASAEDGKKIFEYLTTAGAAPPATADPKLKTAAVAAKRRMDDIGRQLVKMKALSQAAYDKYKDQYLPRLYMRHLLKDDEIARVMTSTGRKPDLSWAKHRKDIPEEVRRLVLGEIKDPAYLLSHGVGTELRDMALLDWIKKISQNQNWTLPKGLVDWQGHRVTPFWLKNEAEMIRRQSAYYEQSDKREALDLAERMDEAANAVIGNYRDVPTGWKQLPDSPRYGALRGMVVIGQIYDDIVGSSALVTDESLAERILGDRGMLSRASALWKWAKVAANPPGQVRNFISNGVLLHLSGVPFHRVPQRVLQAWDEVRNGGAHFAILKKYGGTESTFANEELRRIDTEFRDLLAKQGTLTAGQKARLLFDKFRNFTGDLYQFSEALFKTAKVIDAMERERMSEQDAVLAAQAALFDYSLVTPSLRYLRNAPLGMPFITFTSKALPAMIDIALHHPLRFAPYVALPYVLGALLAGMKDLDDDDVKALETSLPKWLRDKGHAWFLPVKDANDRWQAMDFGYFLPWTTFTAIGDKLAQGKPGEAMAQLGLLGSPVIDIAAAVSTNIDPFTKKEIVNRFDPASVQVASIMNYAWRMAMPTFITDIGVLGPDFAGMAMGKNPFSGKLAEAVTGKTDKYGQPKTTTAQALARLFGANLYPVDPELSRADNLLQMRGELTRAKARMTMEAKAPGLTLEQRQAIVDAYRGEIEQRVKEIREYARESRITDRIKVARN